MDFIITNTSGHILATNIIENGKIDQLLSCSKKSELSSCVISKQKIRQGVIVNNVSRLYLSCTDKNLTNRIFGHYFTVLETLADEVIEAIKKASLKESQKTRRLKHNLINHNTNILQELYKLFSQEHFKNGADHRDVISNVIKNDAKRAAYSFLKVLKFSNLMKAEFDVYEMLDQESPYLDFSKHTIHKVVTLTLSPFWLDLIEKKITISIQQFHGQITIDYKTISVALSHIFDNATKYIAQNSEFKINFEDHESFINIIFDMVSLKVEENEIERIFLENASGQWAETTSRSGDGIGMFMVKKLILLNRGNVLFIPNVDSTKIRYLEGVPYENNIIKIEIKK